MGIINEHPLTYLCHLSCNLISDLNNNSVNNIQYIKVTNNKIICWKYLLGLLSDFNDSKLMYYIKSINNVFADIQIQQKFDPFL